MPESFLGQKTDARQLLSPVVNIQLKPDKRPAQRKLTVYYPLSRQIPFEYARPCFYAIRGGDRHVQLETTLVDERMMKFGEHGDHDQSKLYCVTEIAPVETIALLLEPRITHSGTLFYHHH